MKIRVLLAMLILITGCYAEITGTVVDAETGQPIEGAVVLVEWTKTHGFGHTYTESYKVIEAFTDKDGKATITGTFSPTVNYPHVTVYKKGYVAWNNEMIFPDYKKRTDFKWKNGYVFRLERFKEDIYTHRDHVMFLYNPVGDTPKYSDAIRWETGMMQKEKDKVINKFRRHE